MKKHLLGILSFFSTFIFGFAQTDTVSYTAPKPSYRPVITQEPQKSIFFGIDFLGQFALNPFKPGVIAISKTGKTEEVTLNAGGGMGIEGFVGGYLNSDFRLAVYLGYQFSSGTPSIEDWTVNFRRGFTAGILQYEIRVTKENRIIIGAGPQISFANRAYIKDNNGRYFSYNYKPYFGIALQAKYEESISDKFKLFAGFRYQSGNGKIDSISFMGNPINLDQEPELFKEFNNKDFSALGLELGMVLSF
jgi:hypothetical protein